MRKFTLIYVCAIVLAIGLALEMYTLFPFTSVAIILLLVGYFIISSNEKKSVINGFEKISKSSTKSIIDYLKQNSQKAWFSVTKNYCDKKLVIYYMITDDACEAKRVMFNNKKLRKDKELFYISFILALAEKDDKNINLFYKSINSINDRGYEGTIRNTNRIMQMINSNKMDEEIFNNTKYPILKRICSKYSDNPIVIDDLSIVEEIWMPSIKTKVINFSLIFLSVISIIIGIVLHISSIIEHDTLILVEFMYHFIKYFWIYLLFLPITILTFNFGLYYSSKYDIYNSSLFVGAISSVILYSAGVFTLLSVNLFTYDIECIDVIESYVSDIPENREVIGLDYELLNTEITVSYSSSGGLETDIEPSDIEELQINKSYAVRFDESDELLQFERNLVNNDWKYLKPSYSWVPNFENYENDRCQYFYLYSNTYAGNMLKFNNVNYKFKPGDYIYLAYDTNANVLLIYEFSIYEMSLDQYL